MIMNLEAFLLCSLTYYMPQFLYLTFTIGLNKMDYDVKRTVGTLVSIGGNEIFETDYCQTLFRHKLLGRKKQCLEVFLEPCFRGGRLLTKNQSDSETKAELLTEGGARLWGRGGSQSVREKWGDCKPIRGNKEPQEVEI